MAERKEGTHIVFKIEDAQKYLTDDERQSLAHLLGKVQIGRANDGKPFNQYYICNADEPYADKVLQAILDGEDAREAYKKAYATACEDAREDYHFLGIHRTDEDVKRSTNRILEMR